MANFLGNIAIGSAVMVSVLTLIDWLLTESQKKGLGDKAISVWVWLDDNRSIDFLRKFKDYREQVKLSATLQIGIASAFVGIAILSFLTGDNATERFAIWFAVGAVVAAPVMLDLAKHIVTQKTAEFEPEKFEDHYEEALVELINAKRQGKTIGAKPRPKGENVVDLMDALKKSLATEAVTTKGKKPRKASAGQKEMLLPIEGKKPAEKKAGKAERSTGRKKAG